jgi:hypothetical protein
MSLTRRNLLTTAAAALAAPALAQHNHGHHAGQFERLAQPGRVGLPEIHAQQAVTESPAPKAAMQGAWRPRAPLPIPRTEMAWAAEYRGRMHLVGGYAEQRVDRNYHHAYDPAADSWEMLAEHPRGSNHVGVATHGDRLYAFGGFIEQNRTPHDGAFAFDGHEMDTRCAACPRLAARSPASRSATTSISSAARSARTTAARSTGMSSMITKADRYSRRQPMPLGRDHSGIVAVNGADPHHRRAGGHASTPTRTCTTAMTRRRTQWTFRAPIPTARSGQGTVWFNNRIFNMGGEGTNRVYGQTEAYDPATDRWESYAPMLTPRHGMGAVVLGNAIYVAGGGPQMGGGMKSAINEAFSLA